MHTQRLSDLAVENFGFALPAHSSVVTEKTQNGFTILHAQHEAGEYHTVVSGKIWQESSDVRRKLLNAVADILREKIGKSSRVLFCGIGNPAVPSDSLGAKIAGKLIVTGEAHTPSVFAIRPSIPAHTGIDTADFLRCIAEMLSPDVIIAADALAARSRERLQTVIQIADALTPGSALAHTSGEISGRTMPCPVISIGVPTVISTAALSESDDEPLLMTRAESDIITDCYASVIGGAINSALFGK